MRLSALLPVLFCLVFPLNHAEVLSILRAEQAASATCKNGRKDCDLIQLPSGDYFFNNCDAYDKRLCGSDHARVYECCVGYQMFPKTRKVYQPEPCQSKPNWVRCLERMALYGFDANRIAQLQQSFSLPNDTSYTIFITAYGLNSSSSWGPTLTNTTASNSTEAILHAHIVQGRYFSHDLYHGMDLLSAQKANHKYHVSRADTGLLFIDCVRVIESDKECPNGVVHLLDRALMHSPKEDISPWEQLQKTELGQDFSASLPEAIRKELATPQIGKHYTVLLPTEETWKSTKDRFSKADDLALIAQNHVFKDFLCLEALNRRSPVKSPVQIGDNAGQEFVFDGPMPKTVSSNDCPGKYNITSWDNIRLSTIVHNVQGVLVPKKFCNNCQLPQQMPYTEIIPHCLVPQNISTWWNYMKDCDLKIEAGKKYSWLIPVNSAFDWWKSYEPFKVEYEKFHNDKEYRCKTIRYHIMSSAGDEPTNMKKKMNQTVALVSNAKDGDSSLYQSLYQSSDKPENARLTDNLRYHYLGLMDPQPIEFQNHWIYRTDKVSALPQYKIVDFMKSRDDLSSNLGLVGQPTKDLFAKNSPNNLYLASKNDPLAAYLKEQIPADTPDTAKASYNSQFNLLHTVPWYLWASDIGYFKPGQNYYFKNQRGEMLVFQRQADGSTLKIGHAEDPADKWSTVIEFNHRASDGMVWLLDRPLNCRACLPKNDCGTDSVLKYKENIPECLLPKQIDQWWKYMQECDLLIAPESKYTWLMPLNKAFDWWKSYEPFKKEYEKFLSDKEYRCNTIRYHIMVSGAEAPTTDARKLNETVYFKTNARGELSPLYQSVYQSPDPSEYKTKNNVWYHYSRLVDDSPLSFKNHWLYRTDRVSVMPNYKIVDYMKSRDDMSTNHGLIGERTKKTFAENAPGNLYLATLNGPLGESMKAAIPEGTSAKAREGYQQSYNRLHTVPWYLWASDIGYFQPGQYYYFNSQRGERLMFYREGDVLWIGIDGDPKEKWSKVVEFNHRASDGIVWVLDRPLECRQCLVNEACDVGMVMKYKEKIPDCLIPKKIDQWWTYMQECDLYIESANKYTWLMPVNSAFDWWKSYEPFKAEYDRFMSDKDYRCETIRYHIMISDQGATYGQRKINKTVAFKTNNRKENPFYQSLYYGNYYAGGDTTQTAKFADETFYHYARVIDSDPIEFHKQWLYRVDRVNVMPGTGLLDYVKSRSDLGLSHKLAEKVAYRDHLSKNAPNTLFLLVKDQDLASRFDEQLRSMTGKFDVPKLAESNGTIEKEIYDQYSGNWQTEFKKNKYRDNEQDRKEYVWSHTVPHYLWGGDIGYFAQDRAYWHLNGLEHKLGFWRDTNGLWIGYQEVPREKWSKVIEFNHRAWDGMAWVLDKPIFCPEDKCPLVKFELDIDILSLFISSCRTEAKKGSDGKEIKLSEESAAKNPENCVSHFVDHYRNIYAAT